MNNSDIDMRISIMYGKSHLKWNNKNICEEVKSVEKESREWFRNGEITSQKTNEKTEAIFIEQVRPEPGLKWIYHQAQARPEPVGRRWRARVCDIRDNACVVRRLQNGVPLGAHPKRSLSNI
jgi:hypothetical protein